LSGAFELTLFCFEISFSSFWGELIILCLFWEYFFLRFGFYDFFVCLFCFMHQGAHSSLSRSFMRELHFILEVNLVMGFVFDFGEDFHELLVGV